MKIPLSWLKDYLPLEQHSVEEIANALTLAGLEVDKIEKSGPQFSGVVVARVISAEQHPNADKLRVAKVFDGTEELQIVCGAANCRAGIKVALAKIGATLYDETGKAFKIKKGKLRDVESFGMLCSAKELNLSEDAQGIIELADTLAEGTDLSPLFQETILEIGLTPNLGHCMSVLGIARELSAILQLPLKKPSYKLHEDDSQQTEKMISLRVEDTENCKRFACRVVTGITVGPSPEWMKRRLEASGMRSVNNVVDVGNYIMLAIGQPLHLFDYDAIAGKQLIITSKTNEPSLTTLDDNVRAIPEKALLICDKEKPLSFAGIMGGISSAVSDKTVNILIESAHFKPESIRRTSKLLNLRTEGSQRWERGVDPEAYAQALDDAAALLQECAGGKIAKGTVVFKEKIEPRTILCRVDRVNQILGTKLSLNEITALLKRLELEPIKSTESTLLLQIPSYRNDLNIEIDIIEEIARIYGFNNITQHFPEHIDSPLPHTPMYLFEREMRDYLIGEGLQECLTCDLISPKLADLTVENGQSLISVLYPTSIEQSILRVSLLPGLLQVIKHNQDHLNLNVSAFELGRIHFKDKERFVEQTAAGIILCGNVILQNWSAKTKEVDFYDLKGKVENILKLLGISDATYEPSHFHNFHPYRQARIKVGAETIGSIGEIHPNHLSLLGIDRRVYYAELNLEDLAPLKRKFWSFSEFSTLMGSQRDWTLPLKAETPIDTVFQAIKTVASPFLERIELLDLYQNEQIGKDKKNATFRFFYRDVKKTIAQETVEREHAKITQAVAEKLRDHLL